MDDFKSEKIVLDDGRIGEKIVKDNGDEHIIEIHVEPERPKYLGKRIVETKRPCVVRRQIETFNEKGEVVDKKVEALESENKMHYVQAISPDYVTKADLNDFAEKVREGIVAAVAASQPVVEKKTMASPYSLGVAEPVEEKPKTNKHMMWVLIIVAQLAALWWIYQM